jgi:hypothetical protein
MNSSSWRSIAQRYPVVAFSGDYPNRFAKADINGSANIGFNQ